MSCDVHWNRLSPSTRTRSFGPFALKRAVTIVCFFADTEAPTTDDEMCVVAGSPKYTARLLAAPTLTPVDGFAPKVGMIGSIGFR